MKKFIEELKEKVVVMKWNIRFIRHINELRKWAKYGAISIDDIYENLTLIADDTSNNMSSKYTGASSTAQKIIRENKIKESHELDVLIKF